MTLSECVAKRLTKVRLPQWSKGAYLEFYVKDELYGPWATLVDPICEAVLKIEPEDRSKHLWMVDTSTEWEAA
jgi:hypothetical protein